MQDQEKYKHKVGVSRRNPYIRFFCWAWDTSPERLDICKLIWGTLGLVLLPFLYLFFALVALWDRTKVRVSRRTRVRTLFMEFYDIKRSATDVPVLIYGGGVVLMALLTLIVGPFVLLLMAGEAIKDKIDDVRHNRRMKKKPRRIMTEENLGRFSGGASQTTARGSNVFQTIWLALPVPVRTMLKGPWFVLRLPVLAVKAVAKGTWAALQFGWRQLARVPLWVYGIVGLLGVSVTLSAVFDFPVVLAVLVAFGTVGLVWLIIRLFSKYRVIARIKEGGKTFGRTIAAYGRSLKYNTCPQIVVKD